MVMKKFLNKVWQILEEIGRTRAAAAMARSGDVVAAQHLMK